MSTGSGSPSLFSLQKNLGIQATNKFETYYTLFDKKLEGTSTEENENLRKQNYTQVSMNYYDLATDFYEYGWGESFHFGPRGKRETIPQSIARAEWYVALRLGLKPGMKVLDVGCGVGGPMREIARFSGATITGLNLNEYQLKRASYHNKRYGMESLCNLLQGDFMNIPVPSQSFDAVYEIEATPHAPSKEGVYAEIFRTLKPGGSFCGYEWCMTDKYDPSNEEHKKIKFGIELGNGLPEIASTKHVEESLKRVGFEIIELTDFGIQTEQNPNPWYDPLAASFSWNGIKHTQVGRFFTGWMVYALELLKLAPKGSSSTSTVLQNTAYSLVSGGKLGIFTPSFFFLARKPLET
jgi:sterol 24-C-methyltransferase